MKTLFYIKDIRENTFYWSYRLEEGFTKEIREANSFESEEAAIEELGLGYLRVSNRFYEIVKVLRFNE